MQTGLRFCGSRETGDQRAAGTGRRGREAVGIATDVTNVMAAVHRRSDSAEALLLNRAQEIARIGVAAQAGFAHRRRIKAAFESEPRLLGCVVKRADHEVFAIVALRAPGKFFVFISEPLHDFGPGNVGA